MSGRSSSRKVTQDDLKAFHDAFYGAGAGEVAIVGSFDETATAKLIGELFGSWKSPAAYERAPAEVKTVPGKVEASRRRISRTRCISL